MLRKLWMAGLVILVVGSAAGFGLRWIAAAKPPRLALAPDVLDFGRVAIGESEEGLVVVTNTDDRPLRVEFAPAKPPFDSAVGSLALEPGESRILSVLFTPAERGPIEATLAVASEGHEFALPLRGTGHRPAEIQVSPLSVSFGDVAVGTVAEGLVTIRNAGDEGLELAVRGNRRFRPGTQSAVVPPGEMLALDVSFAPDRLGRLEETLRIESNDPHHRLVALHLRGSGVKAAPRPVLDASADALDFGMVSTCGSSERWLEVENGGSDPLVLASVTASPPFWAPSRSFRLEPGRFVRLPVAFAPTEAGAVLSPLLIHSNDPHSRLVVVSLTGEGSAEDCASPGREARAEGGEAGRGVELRFGGGPGPILSPAEEGSRSPAGADSPAESASPEAVATAPVVREGSFVDLGSHRADITPEHVASVRLDPASGNLTLDVHLPVVELPFDQFFDFEPTAASGRVSGLGDVDLVLPVQLFDEEGNATRLEVPLTTRTAANLRADGTLVTLAGESLGARGDATLVGLATLPSGGFGGSMLEIVLNVHVQP